MFQLNAFFLTALLFVLSNPVGWAQVDDNEVFWLKGDVNFLASDQLGGRLAGSDFEKLAADYIRNRFRSIGLEGAGVNGSYFHDFDFMPPAQIAPKGNYLTIGGEKLRIDVDYYPLAPSGNGKFAGELVDIGFGIEAPHLGHNDFESVDLEGAVVLVDLGLPGGVHPHSKFFDELPWQRRLEKLMVKKPKAIVCYHANADLSPKGLRAYNNLAQYQIPVVHLGEEAVNKVAGGQKVKGEVTIWKVGRSGRNVLAQIQVGAAETVVIGAHYDHLGLGEFGNSLHTGPAGIHNGADDNASGVALLLALAARLQNQRESLKHNYLFVAFSAEELGLLGSNAFVNSHVFTTFKPRYMLNFDMVGRLDSTGALGIFGNGTSPQWAQAIHLLDTSSFTINRNPSGMGSSDHTSFYLKDIPVLHFFTGTHGDYHKPTDDAEKLNYGGMARVLDLSHGLVMALDAIDGMDFRKTKTGNSRKAPSFKVTLGIIPDYFGHPQGLKIDGVSEGKPAQRAGLQKGDIITHLGDHEVKDMMGYMQALAHFSPGEVTAVKVLRNGEPFTFEIRF
jgi:hypothetical protein